MKKIIYFICIFSLIVNTASAQVPKQFNYYVTVDRKNKNSSASSGWGLKFNADGTCRVFNTPFADTASCMRYDGKYKIDNNILSFTTTEPATDSFFYNYKSTINGNEMNGELEIKKVKQSDAYDGVGKAILTKL